VNVVVNARHMEVTDSIRKYVQDKVAKLHKFYDNVQSIEVILDHEADRPTVEIVVIARRKHTFVASHRGEDEDMYACFDQCLDKVSRQIRRFKDKVRDRHGPPHTETM